MKKQFMAMVAKLGGSAHYAGNTKGHFTETLMRKELVKGEFGRPPTEKVVQRKKLFSIPPVQKTMFVKGMTEANALQLSKQYMGKSLPFQVVFQ